jgi:hypothetical protein
MAIRTFVAVIGTVMVTVVPAVGLHASADQEPNSSLEAPSRLRPVDGRSRALLNEALRRSATVRRLAAGIDASDLLVYVSALREKESWRGETVLIGTAAGARVLNIRLNVLGHTPDEQLSVLGHELQHVSEVAAAAGVDDVPGIRRLFERIGQRIDSSGGKYETAAAQRVENQVRAEIRGVR